MPVPPPPPPPPLPPPPPPLGAPPPPPPSAPPASTEASSLRKADPKGRSALLADIQQGTRLRKVTQINDRSAPQIESSKGANKEGGGSANSRGGSTPPALGDLFAGGFPVLRPAGQRDAAGGKTGQAPGSRAPSPRLPTKTISGPLNTPASPRLGTASEARTAPVQALPAPPAPPGQPFLQKKRPGRGPGTSGGKLNPPPAPPARSPTTELSSRSQQAPGWTPTPQPGGQLRNGGLHMHIIDDFESKFTFHSVEDFPPPDEYKPCQKIYPSKIPRSRTPGPWLHAEAAGQSSDDIKGRNSQLTLKTLR
ncbi:PREDICTED: WAS/WASL-interacting protein family member 3 [Myotis brandtii]|uniref:WAS/WASL-interacting protein family member 3 n=1 Tax=Myotis brandtii TaxID=109478 RepID=UPI0003BB7693|nr:PREDICTED: WAS/WASL-interacting protein family member 3 [Myotis brandtii]